MYRAICIICLFFVAPPALANIAVPTLFLTMPGMFLALIPIVVVEAAIFSSVVNLSYKKSFKPILMANVFTTVIGMFLSSAFHLLIGLLVGAFDGGGDVNRAIVLGVMILDDPFETSWGAIFAAFLVSFVMFLMSMLCEYLALIKMNLTATNKVIFSGCCLANLASYCVIFIWLSFVL